MKQAAYSFDGGVAWDISTRFYSSLEEAKKDLAPEETHSHYLVVPKVVWPAHFRLVPVVWFAEPHDKLEFMVPSRPIEYELELVVPE